MEEIDRCAWCGMPRYRLEDGRINWTCNCRLVQDPQIQAILEQNHPNHKRLNGQEEPDACNGLHD